MTTNLRESKIRPIAERFNLNRCFSPLPSPLLNILAWEY